MDLSHSPRFTPLLSILIATKNREKYCIASVKAMLDLLASGDVEIVISDNSSSLAVQEYINTLEIPSITYIHSREHLSSIDNFNMVMSMAKGEYVCLIGDDDIVLPRILEFTRWAKGEDVDTFTFPNIRYMWPNPNLERKNGNYTISQYSGKIEVYDTQEQLKSLLKSGIVGYLHFQLPKVYHGVVKRSLMSEVKARTGCYFGGLTPDIYACVALSILNKKHIVLDVPLSIAGVCPESTSAQSIAGGHSGKLEDAPHLVGRETYKWNSEIPAYYSVETIWADTAFTAIKAMGAEKLLGFFKRRKLFCEGIWKNRKWIFWHSVGKTLEVEKSKFAGFILLLFSFIPFFAEKIVGKLGRKSKKIEEVTIDNISNIEVAKESILLSLDQNRSCE